MVGFLAGRSTLRRATTRLAKFFTFALLALVVIASLNPAHLLDDLWRMSIASGCSLGLLVVVMFVLRAANEAAGKSYSEAWDVGTPLVEWTPAAALPVDALESAERGAYRSHGRGKVARYVANEKVAAKARRSANVLTTVADEAVIDEGRLVVREENDVASVDLSSLRDEEVGSPSGGTTFVFGRATRVVFLNEDNDAVRALREMLPSSSRPAM